MPNEQWHCCNVETAQARFCKRKIHKNHMHKEMWSMWFTTKGHVNRQRFHKNLENSTHTCKLQYWLFWHTNTKKNQVGTLSTRILQVSRGTLNLSFVNHAVLKVGLQSRGRASFGASTNACRVWPEESSLYSTWNTTLIQNCHTCKWFVEEVDT